MMRFNAPEPPVVESSLVRYDKLSRGHGECWVLAVGCMVLHRWGSTLHSSQGKTLNTVAAGCCHTVIEGRAAACHGVKLEVMASAGCQAILNPSSGCRLWASGGIGDVTRHAHPLISAHCQKQTGPSEVWRVLLDICHKQLQQAFIIQLRFLLETCLCERDRWDYQSCFIMRVFRAPHWFLHWTRSHTIILPFCLELIHLLNASKFVFICRPDYWTADVGKGCCFSVWVRQKASRGGNQATKCEEAVLFFYAGCWKLSLTNAHLNQNVIWGSNARQTLTHTCTVRALQRAKM